MLNYETKWMNRDQIVESTYEAASSLNSVKHKHGLVKLEKFKKIDSRIKQAQDIIRTIDEKMKKVPQTSVPGEQDMVEDFEISPDRLKYSTICDKDELRWPIRFFGLNLPKGSLKFLPFIRIGNILKLILFGDKRS